MLTKRQQLLLKAIIEEFMETAGAVGSLNISEKYALDVSPATIRNEMAKLSEMGFLEKSHASSGRKPTSRAMRFFVNQLMDEIDVLDSLVATTSREALFQKRFDVDNLLRYSVESLSNICNQPSLVMVSGRKYSAGIYEFIDQIEYQDIKKLKLVLSIIEDYDSLMRLFDKSSKNQGSVNVLIGDDTGIDELSDSAILFTEFSFYGQDRGYLGVIGPSRMRYRVVIPAIQHVAENIEDVVQGW